MPPDPEELPDAPPPSYTTPPVQDLQNPYQSPYSTNIPSLSPGAYGPGPHNVQASPPVQPVQRHTSHPVSRNSSPVGGWSGTQALPPPPPAPAPAPAPVQTRTQYRVFDPNGRVQTQPVTYVSKPPSALPAFDLRKLEVPLSQSQFGPQAQSGSQGQFGMQAQSQYHQPNQYQQANPYPQSNTQNAVQPQPLPYSYQAPKEKPKRTNRAAPRQSRTQKGYLPYVQPNPQIQYSSPYNSRPQPEPSLPQGSNLQLGQSPVYAEQDHQSRQQVQSQFAYGRVSSQHNEVPNYHDPGPQGQSPSASERLSAQLNEIRYHHDAGQQGQSQFTNGPLSSQHNEVPNYQDPEQQMLQPEDFRTPTKGTTNNSLLIDSAGYSPIKLSPIFSSPNFSSPNLNTIDPGPSDAMDVDGVIQGVLAEQIFGDDIDSEETDDDVGFKKALYAEEEEEEEEEEEFEDRAFDEVEEPEESDEESDFAAGSDIMSRDDGEISDADSVIETYDKQVSAFRKEVQKVRDEHGKTGKKSKSKKPAQAAKSKGGGQKGPRKIAELSGDIKMRLHRATGFFMVKNYHEARREAKEIIKINGEVHQAYSMLAAIFREWGDFDEELLAMQSCCHFLPKEEAGMSWLALARRIDEASPEVRQTHLTSGEYCCAGALKTLRNNVEALCLKGSFCKDQNHAKKARILFERALKADPHNPKALRGLAECYLDHNEPELAKKIYKEAIDFYRESDLSENRFGWNEIAIYTELYASAGENAEALKHLKSLARWVLGREEEDYWDDITDDREWDIDESRKFGTKFYAPDEYDPLTYGDGLPLELRTKMGILRLKLGDTQEALKHFGFLESEAQFCDNDELASLADLFHDVGDKLCEAECYEDALTFYEILKRLPADEDLSRYMPMGKCYLQVDDAYNAEQSYLTLLQYDSKNIAARHELAKIYDAFDKEEAAKYRQEIRDMTETEIQKRRREEREERAARASSKQAEKSPKQPKTPKTFIARKIAKPSRRTQLMEINANEIARQRQREEERIAGLLRCYETLQRCKEGLEAGDQEETSEWMAAAAELVADFRTCKGLYPYDKFYYSSSYVPRSQKEKEKARQNENQSAAPNEKQAPARGYIVPPSAKREYAQRRRAEMPTSHLGLSFAIWLDILIPYALCLARQQRYLDAYDVCISAKEAVVYCHVQESMFTIYLCWCTCATLANDMDTIVSQLRHFMKEYQFTTDAYRLFSTLVRLCQSPLSHLTKGPTTKYLLRNIKTMDFALTEHATKEGNPEFAGMASYTAREADGRLVINKEMDINLLLLYGHILFVNTSFGKALHYLFRAYSLDKNNPIITMSVGLCYIQYALKRQTQYRPYVIMQGISFMIKYYDSRKRSAFLEEREEAHYNMARTYHMLGINHLAIPYYVLVLNEEEEAVKGGWGGGREDLAIEAAYNLQCVYAVAGNMNLAKAVTEKWLVC